MRKINLFFLTVLFLLSSCESRNNGATGGASFGGNFKIGNLPCVVVCNYKYSFHGGKKIYSYYPLIIKVGSKRNKFQSKLSDGFLVVDSLAKYKASVNKGDIMIYDTDKNELKKVDATFWDYRILGKDGESYEKSKVDDLIEKIKRSGVS